jgi:GNAT superfamily N-acetyltransferase
LSRRLADLTLDSLDDLPQPCRQCVFWELDPVSRRRAEDLDWAGAEKRAWLSTALREWGPCGKVAYVDGAPAGFVLYAPAGQVPQSRSFATSPISADAVLLVTARVLPEYAGAGLGKILVQAVAKQLLRRRGIKAMEAFGDARWERPACVLPVGYLEAVGFQTVRFHPRYPRMRLDLRTALTWRAEVEVAVERLLGAVRPETAPRPVPVSSPSRVATKP